MPHTPESLFAFLEEHGIQTKTVTHAPLFTVEESQALRGEIPGGHIKNLFLKDHKKRLWLVVAREETRVELKALPERIGSGRMSFGSAELLDEVLGVPPGSVTPFALINDTGHQVTLVLDEDLLKEDPINCHPLINTMTTAIARDDLMRFFTLTGHTPILARLAG